MITLPSCWGFFSRLWIYPILSPISWNANGRLYHKQLYYPPYSYGPCNLVPTSGTNFIAGKAKKIRNLSSLYHQSWHIPNPVVFFSRSYCPLKVWTFPNAFVNSEATNIRKLFWGQIHKFLYNYLNIVFTCWLKPSKRSWISPVPDLIAAWNAF